MQLSRRRLGHAALALASAAALAPVTTSPAHATVAAVTAAIDALKQALMAADANALKELLADDLVYVHSSGKVENKVEVIEIVGGKKTVYRKVAFDDVKVTGAGTNNAVARAVFSGEAETDGKVNPFKVGTLMVFAKDGATWRLIARQAYRLA